MIKFYSKEGDTILDPFAGHNSRMESAFMTERDYIGFDICEEFMQFNESRKAELLQKNAQSMIPIDAEITLYKRDSREIINYIAADSCDFCVTSPPFWNIEYYGPEEDQLGLLSYTSFITAMESIARNCYECLKQGSYIAWEVNDFRANGKFYAYHRDTIALFEAVGFKIHDVIIVDYGAAFLQSFLSDVAFLKVMPKQHAYIIVAKKEGKREYSRSEYRGVLLEKAKEAPINENEQMNLFEEG